MQNKRSKLFKTGIITLIILVGLAILYAILYVGYCTGELGQHNRLLRYVFRCSCPRSWENIRVQKLYSERAEIMFSACDAVGPVPSPSGQKIAVINYKAPAQSYIWFLKTDERIPFSWLDVDLDWLADDLLFVRTCCDMNVVELGTGAEYPIPVRTDVRLASGEIASDVLSALREAGYVIFTPKMVVAISPDALASPEHSFIIPYDEFAFILDPSDSYFGNYERIRQFLQDQNIDYLDYTDKRGTDVLSINSSQKYRGVERESPLFADLVSPDGRFFYRDSFYDRSESGIYLVETGEKIVDSVFNTQPIDWVYDGVIVRRVGFDWVIAISDWAPIRQFGIPEPWYKLRVPAEYNVFDIDPD
ncbi:MAG: hypothetical protein GY832_27375 [Chloroflexi bacterium]|nr:hypothetical protein [Chloroflexota bacterium]